MKLTKEMFHDWVDDDDMEFDDELIIEHDPEISSRSIADSILSNQDKLEKLYALDLSKVIRFTGTMNGDQHEEHNDIINILVKILVDKQWNVQNVIKSAKILVIVITILRVV